MNHEDITGIIGITVLVVAVTTRVTLHHKIPLYGRWVLCLVVGLFVVTPIEDLSVAVYVRGVIGDLSITTLVLLSIAILRRVFGLSMCSDAQIKVVYGLVISAGLIFYPMALGLGAYDPYSLGYGSTGLLSCSLLLAIVARFYGYSVVSLCLALAVGAYAMDYYASTNLWDYLIDPLVVVYAIIAWTYSALSTRNKHVRDETAGRET